MFLPFDTIERTVDFDERASAMQLRPWQWEFLLAADGRTRLGDLARLCGLDFESAVDLVRETESIGLVEIVTLTLEGYRAAAAHLVTPLAAPESPVAFAAPVESAPAVPEEPPVALAAPRKSVSVSFDSFSTMVDSWETEAPGAASGPAALEVAPYAPTPADHEIIFDDSIFVPDLAPLEAPRSEHDFPENPLLENEPIDFEFPDRMTPLADQPTTTKLSFSTSDSYADLFAEPQSSNGNGVYHDTTETNHAHEPLTFEASPYLDTTHAETAAVEPARDPFAPLPPFGESATPAPKKNVSFSLTADSFGLPNMPLEETTLETHAPAFESVSEPTHESRFEPASRSTFEDTPEPTVASREDFARELRASHGADVTASAPAEPITLEQAPPEKKDDVLLQHFHVPSAPEDVSTESRNGDLAGAVLRVLGLKK